MNYDEALNYITNTSKFGINMGLKRISSMLRIMGNPDALRKTLEMR
jgi:dihydrofolate synthase/folylpolyglutamate synthase